GSELKRLRVSKFALKPEDARKVRVWKSHGFNHRVEHGRPHDQREPSRVRRIHAEAAAVYFAGIHDEDLSTSNDFPAILVQHFDGSRHAHHNAVLSMSVR